MTVLLRTIFVWSAKDAWYTQTEGYMHKNNHTIRIGDTKRLSFRLQIWITTDLESTFEQWYGLHKWLFCVLTSLLDQWEKAWDKSKICSSSCRKKKLIQRHSTTMYLMILTYSSKDKYPNRDRFGRLDVAISQKMTYRTHSIIVNI